MRERERGERREREGREREGERKDRKRGERREKGEKERREERERERKREGERKRQRGRQQWFAGTPNMRGRNGHEIPVVPRNSLTVHVLRSTVHT